jgi:hypothetical protein
VRDGAEKDTVQAVFRSKARRLHPDSGGSHEAMTELNDALKEALAEVGS